MTTHTRQREKIRTHGHTKVCPYKHHETNAVQISLQWDITRLCRDDVLHRLPAYTANRFIETMYHIASTFLEHIWRRDAVQTKTGAS